MAIPPGTLLDNKYTVEQAIGRGGFGFVYRARDQVTGETVAIKELTPALADDPHMVQRFIQEARATLRLTHPNIARTHGIFQQSGVYYLVMEFLQGGSLSDHLQGGSLPVEDVLLIAEGLCAALSYAHGEGVVHCDLKPANVLFDARGRVRLADFGIAHISGQMMTRGFHTGTGTAMGTPQYMAPEQLEGVRDDPRVDVYALGALLYEMLAGRSYVDFEPGTTPAEQIRNFQRIQSQPPRPLREVNPGVPEWLAGVVEKALVKAPGERFQTVADLGAALRPPPTAPPPVGGTAIAQRPVAAPPPGPVAPSVVPSAARPPVAALRQSPPASLRKMLPWALGGAGMLLSLVLISVVIVAVAAAIRGAASVPTMQPTPVLLPALGDTRTRSTDGMEMVYVPEGMFEMGSTDGFGDEQPVHSVTLDGFWIDRHEVTVAQFRDFVQVTGHETTVEQQGWANAWVESAGEWQTVNGANWAHPQGPGTSAPEEHPVTQVSWEDATAYCTWAGARLPTEAQWEYAARGPEGYVYPWGNTFDGTRLNYCDSNCPGGGDTSQDDGYALTAPAGSYQSGASWSGALDMAGNVWEWMAGWYGDYASGAQTNPEGPASGEYRMVRGGAWGDDYYGTRSSVRGYVVTPYGRTDNIGFRCAVAAPGP